MNLVELVAVLAVFQFLGFGVLTGMAREKTGVKAPAVTGDPAFERMYRVQMNTLELLVPFIVVLFLAANHWSAVFVAICGVVYLVGRTIFWRAYVSDPSKRTLGFLLSFFPIVLLGLAVIVGNLF